MLYIQSLFLVAFFIAVSIHAHTETRQLASGSNEMGFKEIHVRTLKKGSKKGSGGKKGKKGKSGKSGGKSGKSGKTGKTGKTGKIGKTGKTGTWGGGNGGQPNGNGGQPNGNGYNGGRPNGNGNGGGNTGQGPGSRGQYSGKTGTTTKSSSPSSPRYTPPNTNTGDNGGDAYSPAAPTPNEDETVETQAPQTNDLQDGTENTDYQGGFASTLHSSVALGLAIGLLQYFLHN